ncbi:MAG: LLM class F420-dependent oxidoreductase [Pseudonocardia sp.]|nr:LLM class F420-dependent oxidoreductase [Pseudonocardia sp.]
MKIGIGAFLTDRSVRPDVLARAIEERGFESLLLPEHSHIPTSRESRYPAGGEMPGYYSRIVSPFPALAAAAAVTRRITLGTAVTLLPQRDVIHTAKEVATLDLLSDGRILLAVAPGWNREQMRSHGTEPRTRGALLEEQIRALKTIWTNDVAEFHGEHVDFDPLWSWPKPVQRPHVPIYVGGWGPAAVRRARAIGDGWMAGNAPDPAAVKEQLTLLDDGPLVPMTVFGVGGHELDVLDAYLDAGTERVALLLEPAAEADTLRLLDSWAPLVQRLA